MDHINNCLLSGPRLPPLSTPAPTAAVAGPLGAQSPCLPLPHPWSAREAGRQAGLPHPPCAFQQNFASSRLGRQLMTPLPHVTRTRFPTGAQLSEDSGLQQGEVDPRSRCTCGLQQLLPSS